MNTLRVLCFIALISSAAASSEKQNELQAAAQAIVDNCVVNQTFAVSVGFVSNVHGIEFGVVAGKNNATGEPVIPTDTFLFGSGTKPFTAATIMQLVENGNISLQDKATKYVDPVLAKNDTSLVELFGEEASNITVDHLISMQSGLADFDISSVDIPVLEQGTLFPPVASVRAAAATTPSMHFAPGTMTEYSSTNYIVLGMVILGAYNMDSANSYTWDTFPQDSVLPKAARSSAFANTHFPTTGKISDALTVPGSSSVSTNPRAPPTEVVTVYNQSSSILGWTCGNVVAPALEVARFYNALLAPTAGKVPSIVSKDSLATMTQFNPLNYGWAKDFLVYGKGLMIEGCNRSSSGGGGGRSQMVTPDDLGYLGNYNGHGGDTYGFLSEQGYLESIESTISVVSNQDHNGLIAGYDLMCKVVQAASQILYNNTVDLQCMNSTYPHHTSKYVCESRAGQKSCVPSYHGQETKAECDSTCK
jgi:CubicO group peptidase (beta-lactamase class C family)